MRITPVSMANRQNLTPQNSNNISFGKFADDNARDVVRKAMRDACNDDDRYYNEIYKGRDDYHFKLMDEADYLTIYTDRATGIVKGKFDDEFLKSDEGKESSVFVDVLSRGKMLDDLSIGSNIVTLGVLLKSIKAIVTGNAPTLEQLRSKDGGSEDPSERTRHRVESEAGGYYY